jgi:hypothetical protein
MPDLAVAWRKQVYDIKERKKNIVAGTMHRGKRLDAAL